ncbi:hypothetical protein [Natronorubrum sulfidifaciens]|uniref:Uncharacterized protein n=1 Tax=Natronorubrum sulfidifaciens JCM 14089 TaxID=1230460 RepID=L9W5E2_9EURY|nr:hypothetical protein [Natronorubrum sulfidifaciens]ELY44491.1 hypothetical protein C495_11329 [Natronorubrum sulfidifaciens JCM 14089]
MSQELREHVNEVLHETDASSGSLVSTDEADGEDDDAAQTDLLETAAKANDLLESADPDDLLEAVDLETLPDGTEPDSIPAAIAQGDPEQVETLQRLLNLSKLADRGDESALEGAVGELRESIGDGAAGDDSEPKADAKADTADESENDDGSVRETIESAAETVSEASGLDDILERDGDDTSACDDAETGGAESSSELGDQLRSAMASSFDGIGDDLEQLRDRLEEASTSAAGGESEREDDTTEDGAESDADDGLLDGSLGSDRNHDTSGGSGTRYSTMAPPPSERADMNGPVRHSTMPDSNATRR